MAKTTFPVTITGMNITERGVEGKYGPQDKAGITIQEANVIDENGQNVTIPAGSWLNGFTPAGALNTVAVGQQISIQIKTKPNPNGGMYYNFGYYPTAAPVAPATPVAQSPVAPVAQPEAVAPAPVATPQGEFATVADLELAVQGLQNQIDELSF